MRVITGRDNPCCSLALLLLFGLYTSTYGPYDVFKHALLTPGTLAVHLTLVCQIPLTLRRCVIELQVVYVNGPSCGPSFQPRLEPRYLARQGTNCTNSPGPFYFHAWSQLEYL
ncbi:hypothetical protein EDB85DRAFT_1932421, partial [Lactarius pseudohatsudake]